jgi:hypothetical protein
MPLRRPSGRALRIGILLLVVALAVVAERAGWVASLLGPTNPPVWIWGPWDLQDVRPRAFLLARDFELGEAPGQARLSVLGDQEYLLWINGHRVGSNHYQDGAPLDVYDVAPLLVEGENRVLLELRSAAGSGGATLRLVDGKGKLLVATGPGWRVYTTAWRGLFDGKPLRLVPEAEVLGRSPFGRWGSPSAGPPRPLFGRLLVASHPERARRFRRPLTRPAWRRLPHRDRHRPGLGSLVEFDFGREVSGYLVLGIREPESAAGLVRFGTTPANRLGWAPDAIAITLPGKGVWQDSVPRRFRFVEVAGLDGVLSAAVLPVDPGRVAGLAARAPAAGVFGIHAPPVRFPVQDEIWRRLRSERRPSPGAAKASGDVRSGDAGRSPEPAPGLAAPPPREAPKGP